MSINKYNPTTGELELLAGQGKAEYGASTERKGDIVIPATTAGNFQSVSVVFAQAMPDNDYTIVIDEGSDTWAHCSVNVTNKTTTGFTLFFLNVAGADAPQMSFKYRAFKLYTDTEYNSILNGQRYSTNEVDTGKVWIDGKKIYRKVIHYTGVITSGNGATISNIPAIADIVTFQGTLKNNADNNIFPIGYTWSNFGEVVQQNMPFVIQSNGNITCAPYGFDITDINIIIEYTKTT